MQDLGLNHSCGAFIKLVFYRISVSVLLLLKKEEYMSLKQTEKVKITQQIHSHDIQIYEDVKKVIIFEVSKIFSAYT